MEVDLLEMSRKLEGLAAMTNDARQLGGSTADERLVFWSKYLDLYESITVACKANPSLPPAPSCLLTPDILLASVEYWQQQVADTESLSRRPVAYPDGLFLMCPQVGQGTISACRLSSCCIVLNRLASTDCLTLSLSAPRVARNLVATSSLQSRHIRSSITCVPHTRHSVKYAILFSFALIFLRFGRTYSRLDSFSRLRIALG